MIHRTIAMIELIRCRLLEPRGSVLGSSTSGEQRTGGVPVDKQTSDPLPTHTASISEACIHITQTHRN